MTEREDVQILLFRDEIAAQGVVPRWMRGFWGTRFLYAIGLHLDLLREMLFAGVRARFPGENPDATPLLCRDRKTYRGPEETEEQICARLRKFRKTAAIKGSPVTVLQQLQAYLTPHSPRIRIVNNDGVWVQIDEAGAISSADGAWNWDGNEDLSSRFWVLIWVPAGLWQTDGLYGDPGVFGDPGVIGSTAAAEVVAGVQTIVGEFASMNSRPMHTVLIFDATAWDLQQPDGSWERQSRRNVSANYWPWQGD